MNNWTANRLAVKLADIGLVVTNDIALAYIALMLNEQGTHAPPKAPRIPGDISDCVVHWAPGWPR
jgi:hypothetical protein